MIALALTTNNLPASSTKPVLSRTPLATISTSYSMYSASLGVADDAIAIRTSAGVVPRLHILTVNTENVLVGQVYNVVFVASAKSSVPNLTVAIIYFSVVFSLKRS